jgi:NTP pyrophosphatase (non-canonical NTP hydrolase)
MKNFRKEKIMKDALKKIKEFHEKQGFPLGLHLDKLKDVTFITDELTDVADDLLIIATHLEQLLSSAQGDVRIARVQLMVEELGETVEALANCDEIALLDGLSDLVFVTGGTALTFDLPLAEGLNEVCESNLTKNPRNAATDPRLRDKGSNYIPPDMLSVLSAHKAHRASCNDCPSGGSAKICAGCEHDV